MEPLSLLLLLVMGVVAGGINAAVGSGSLLTLPVLMAVGIPPGVAVRTNTVGMFFSTVGSVLGYRREIDAERPHLTPLVLVSTLGATAGALLLLASPASALDVVVPVLIVVALALVVFQKPLTAVLHTSSRRRADRREAAARQQAARDEAARGDSSAAAASTASTASAGAGERSPMRSPALLGSLGAASVYGGYFTAAQGVLYLGILGVFTGRSMGSVNGVKNLMSLCVNLAAALIYVIAFFALGTQIVWLASLAIAIGSLLGGFFGAHLAKRLPEWALRGVIVVVALFALVREVL